MLTDQQKKMLDFERQWWKFRSSKEQAIKDEFGLSATRYYQRLNALLGDPAAVEYAPEVVSRLRKLRDRKPGSAS